MANPHHPTSPKAAPQRLTSEPARHTASGKPVGSDAAVDPEFDTASPRMQAVLEQVRQYAPSRACLLLRGETGVGKDYLARSVHRLSGQTGRFVDCKITDLPDSLLESELFGYERGAFTGATERRPGRIEAAQHGTLFLNEIGKIPKPIQVKLFGLLDYGEFTRLGSHQPLPAHVRIIAATSENLEEAVRSGSMLMEFYYRISVLPVHIPPLRERKEDIPRLVDLFIHKYSESGVHSISAGALEVLQRYDYPGNVRELEYTIVRALHRARSSEIQVGDLEFSPLGLLPEPARILEAIRTHRYLSRAAAALGMSRPTLYAKIRKYKLPLPAPKRARTKLDAS